jgi:hypothetical protein
MAPQPIKTPEILGPPEEKIDNTPSTERQVIDKDGSESSQKIREREEMAERVAKAAASPPPEKSKPPVKVFSIGPSAKERPDVSTEDIKSLFVSARVPKEKKKKRTAWKSHKGFPKKYPELFWMKGSWLVFDDAWRNSKRTKPGGLRFEGYKRQVSDRTGVCYHQTKKIWKFFEVKGLFLKVLVGRKNLGNLGKEGKRAYLPTIEMLPWNPAHFEKMTRERRK